MSANTPNRTGPVSAALRRILRIVSGDDGPGLSGSYEDDARYNYPERERLIHKCATDALADAQEGAEE